MDKYDEKNHNRQIYNINGCQVTVWFADKHDPDVYDRVKSILLTTVDNSQICVVPETDGIIQKSRKGA